MACPIASGVSRACRDGSAGLVELYVTEFSNYTQGTITSASGIITNVASFLNTGKKFWTYELEFGVGNEIETPKADQKTGTLAIEQVLNFYIPKKQAAVAQQLLALFKQDTLWIVKDKNGAYRLLGQESGMRLGASSAPSGTSGNEQSGYVLSFMGEERTFALEVPSALVTLLKLAA